eukprot:3813609-Prymnesium_polylepis.1
MSSANVPPKMSSTVLTWVPTWLGSSFLRNHTMIDVAGAHSARLRHHLEEELRAVLGHADD